ncbi:MAG: response regulator transcription factor [Fidelibacterota bacterium]|nr:MAG: response regulator transcription factor [Candidatus Neomarinimicrobiota bacterium]
MVEDDHAILKGLEESLTEEHYEVKSAMDGAEGFQMAQGENIDLIILDIMLPSKNGDEICRDLRAAGVQTPILMLTSKQEEVDKVMGLELGADDYVTKPFSIRELQARIRALLRRPAAIRQEVHEATFGNVHIDFKKMVAIKGDKPLKLSAKEFEVLKYLIEREGEVVSRNALLDEVWGYEAFPSTRTVDNFILSLRKKIEDHPSKPSHLLTAHTVGYKFVK